MAFEGFYPAILATFKHIESNYGYDTLERYWRELAEEYYAPVIEKFKKGGLDAIAQHWQEYFAKEPKAIFSIEKEQSRVIVDVKQCPAMYWLEHFKCDIPDWYYNHIKIIAGTLAEKSGHKFEFRQTGNDSYKMIFVKE